MSSVTSETFKAGDTPLPGLKQFGLIAAVLGFGVWQYRGQWHVDLRAKGAGHLTQEGAKK